MKTLTLKNYFFVSTPDAKPIHQWLSLQNLHGSASRSRTRFMKLIEPRAVEVGKVRIELLEKYASKVKEKAMVKKDGKETEEEVEKVLFVIGDFNPETGKMDETETTDPTPAENKRYKIEPEANNKFNEEWKKYCEEDFVIDVTPATREAIYGVKDIYLTSTEKFAGRGAALYDEICLAFEEIKDSDKAEKVEKSEEKKAEEVKE